MKKTGYSDIEWFHPLVSLCTTFNYAFSYHLEDLCILKNLSKKELARRISVHPSTISHWVMERRLPSASSLYLIVKALELDDDERQALISSWHLSSLAASLVEYVELALQEGDEDGGRKAVSALLEGDWKKLYSKRFLQSYAAQVHPERYRKSELSDSFNAFLEGR